MSILGRWISQIKNEITSLGANDLLVAQKSGETRHSRFKFSALFPTAGTPASVGTASQGSATTVSRSDHVHGISNPGSGSPTTIAFNANVGSWGDDVTPARTDHIHPLGNPGSGYPTLIAFNSGIGSWGDDSTPARTDHIHPLADPASGSPAALGTAAWGSSAIPARSDHVHPPFAGNYSTNFSVNQLYFAASTYIDSAATNELGIYVGTSSYKFNNSAVIPSSGKTLGNSSNYWSQTYTNSLCVLPDTNGHLNGLSTVSAGGHTVPALVSNGYSMVFGLQSGSSTGQFSPCTDLGCQLGSNEYTYDAVYAATGVVSTSDERLKREVEYADLGLDFILSLTPVSYKRAPVEKPGNAPMRRHYGLVAQQVETVLNGKDFAGLVKGESKYGLRYEEFIAPIIKGMQELHQRLLSVEDRLVTLENGVAPKEKPALPEVPEVSKKRVPAQRSAQ